jgi:peptidoglycan hydrolase-like protein with peptidoglycan-binding domain
MIKQICIALVTACVVSSTASAIAIPMWRPGGEFYQPEDNTKVLLVQRKNTQTLVVGPSWKASTKDFGLIVPVPSKPTVGEVSESIFDELETLTNQNRYWIYPMMKSVEAAPQYVGSGVTVIEKKDIGKMTVTIVQASDAAGLSSWLTGNGYTLGAYSKENLEYYIQKKGYYFVAMKVNVATSISASQEGGYLGRLNPVSITFASSKPYLPTRSIYSDQKQVNFTIFTLTDKPYYIHGSELQFARPLNTNDMQTAPTLKEYARIGDWLTRSLVSFEPKEIKEDLIINEGARAVRIQNITERRLINPHSVRESSGVTVQSLAKPLFTAGRNKAVFARNLNNNAKGSDVSILQYILMSKGYLANDEMTGTFDTNTKQALALLQDEYADSILKPGKLSKGTGVFGPTTRRVLSKEYF